MGPVNARARCTQARSVRRSTVRALVAALVTVAAAAGLLLTAAPAAVSAAPDSTAASSAADLADPVELVLYWGNGCPHCERERAWLAEIEDAYPNLEITQYEVWYDEENQQRLQDAAEKLGFEASGVPTTVVGERVWIGFSDTIQEEIQAELEAAGAGGSPGGGVSTAPGATSGTSIDVPLLGRIGLDDKSMLVSTLAIGFVDGVNPCSLWVISVLLAIVVRTGSRRRVLAIGSTFLLITAAMYAVFMAGIYSALTLVGYLGAVQVAVAVVAGVFGVVSVKDYFAFKKGISFTISDSAKPGIYRRMRAAAGHEALVPALAATGVLAVGVSLLETPCTAGFPVLWTGMLADRGVGTAAAAVLFLVYMIPFLIDEFLVFGLAVVTMRATKMQELHGRLLKLVAGTTMLALAGVLVLRPETMEDPLGALLVFLAAFAVAGLVHLVTSRVRRTGAGQGPKARTARTTVGS